MSYEYAGVLEKGKRVNRTILVAHNDISRYYVEGCIDTVLYPVRKLKGFDQSAKKDLNLSYTAKQNALVLGPKIENDYIL